MLRSSDLSSLLQDGSIRAMYVSKNEARMLLQAAHWIGYITDHPSVIKDALKGAYVAARAKEDTKLLQVLETQAFQSKDGCLKDRETKLLCTNGRKLQNVSDAYLLAELPPGVQAADADTSSAANMTASQWDCAVEGLQSNAAQLSKPLLQHSEQQIMSTMLRLWGLKNVHPLLQQIQACLRAHGYCMEVLAGLMSQIRRITAQTSQQQADTAGAMSSSEPESSSIPWDSFLQPNLDSDVSIQLENMRDEQLPNLPFPKLLEVLQMLRTAICQTDAQAAYAAEAKKCLDQKLLQQHSAQQSDTAHAQKQAQVTGRQEQGILEAQGPGISDRTKSTQQQTMPQDNKQQQQQRAGQSAQGPKLLADQESTLQPIADSYPLSPDRQMRPAFKNA